MEHEPKRNRGRETALTISLVVLFGGLIAFLLMVVSMGVFAYVAVAMLAFTIVGFLHYVLWGYAMAQNTVGEREELEIENGEADVQRVARHSVQDLSRRRKPD
jgi:CHASE2 domain-containing sensor protein